MHQFTGKVIMILIIISFFLGALVVTFNDEYTLEKNIHSNRHYYPSVKVGEEARKAGDAEEADRDQGY
ncbi:MAG: hypothetical protein A3G34_01550 [Candidatus Lindowbacteria bacterium RIFCSPLOWO2_12_FULL_62_27]|nr:MAG: hypothetical protein A3I06_05950 [Candidatus Lindowbacteria bacterium RIFCSPLOWO2_02_FULL_62_12]OGH58997.1 MAG: hypothetical protein A3G34_01550 [Candidatus Lindowbacteria bacterium RIFCSPLOWO2_12_FULL_62_27]